MLNKSKYSSCWVTSSTTT